MRTEVCVGYVQFRRNMEKEKSNYLKDKIEELETALISARAKFKADINTIKGYFFIIGIGVVFLILHYSVVLLLPTWLLITDWIIIILLFLAAFGIDTEKSKSEIEIIEARKRIYLGLPEPTENKPEYFDSLVKINIENLAAYYSLVKTHTSQSFKVSLLISVVGFALIGAGLVIDFEYDKKTIGYISTGSGVITELISGVLFYLYNKTIRQLKEYHDSLINVQNILLSFKLIESTTDEKVKAEMVTKMLEYLVQKK